RGGLAGVAVVEVAEANTFQNTNFLKKHTKILNNGQRLDVLVAGPAGGGQPGGELAEPGERLGLAQPRAEVTKHRQGLLVAGGGGRVVPSQLLHHAQVVEGLGLGVPVTEVTPDLQGLANAGASSGVVPGERLQRAQVVESAALA